MKVLTQKDNLLKLFFILVILYCVVRFGERPGIEALYRHQSFDLLNRLSEAKSNSSFDFYLGRIDGRIFGPIKSVVAGAALVVFSFIYLQNARARHFALAILVYLLATRYKYLFAPPYGDAASGPFIEAIWLKRHAFNYWALAQQPGFVAGGPKVYLFSIFPTYQAILMNIFQNLKVFLFVNHLIVFIMGSVVITTFRSILLKVFDEKISLLLSLLLLSFPLFQSQVEQLNMEMPSLCFGILAIYYLIDRKFIAAALWVILATMVKGTSIFICLTVIVFAIISIFMEKEKTAKIKAAMAAIVVALFTVAIAYASIYILNNDHKLVMVGPFKALRWMKTFIVGYLFLISFILFVKNFVDEYSKDGETLLAVIRRNYLPSILFICAFFWFVVFINSYGDQYRYRLILAPLTTFCIFYIVQSFLKNKQIIRWTLLTAILFSFFCDYGFLYKPAIANVDAVYERSLEYRNDLKLDRYIARSIENDYSDLTILAPFSTAQILAFPELGYVHKKLDVVQYGYPCTYEDIKVFDQLASFDLNKTIWVSLETKLPKNMEKILKYPVSPDDKVVKEINIGRKKAQLFLGGYAIEERRRLIDETVTKHPGVVVDPDKF